MSRGYAIIDIDGCIGDYLAMLALARSEQDLPRLFPPQTYGMTDWEPLDREHANRCFADPDFYRRMWPIRGALPALHTLAHFYDLVVCTARGTTPGLPTALVGDIQMATISWLEAWQVPFTTLHFVPGDQKATYLREDYGADIRFAVEDSPQAAQGFNDLGILTYVPAYPYNATVSGTHIRSVAGLEAVVEDRYALDELPLVTTI